MTYKVSWVLKIICLRKLSMCKLIDVREKRSGGWGGGEEGRRRGASEFHGPTLPELPALRTLYLYDSPVTSTVYVSCLLSPLWKVMSRMSRFRTLSHRFTVSGPPAWRVKLYAHATEGLWPFEPNCWSCPLPAWR